MDWKECKDKKLIKERKEDINLRDSLINQSSKKLYSSNILELNDKTATSKISLIYDSIRELLEAIATKKGYKIYNHECYCAFLKEIVKDSEAGSIFDEFRKIRNGINYYGKDITKDEAKELVKNMLLLRKKLEKYLL